MRLTTILTALLLALAPSTATAQILPVPFSSTAPSTDGIQTSGIWETAPITLDGAVLLRVVEPLSAGPVPITDRANTVETALQEVLAPVELNGRATTAYDPATIKIGVRDDNGQTVLAATDARHREPLTIVTVTGDDAQYYGDSVADLAAQWQAALQDALVRGLQKRQPATMRQHVTLVEEAGIALVLFTAIMLVVLAAISRRLGAIHEEEQRRRTEAERRATRGGTPETTHQQRRRLLAFALRAMRGDEPGRALRSLRTTLVYGLLLLWFATIVWALSLFPETTPYASSLAHDATAILGTWIIAAVLNRLLDFAITRGSNAWARDGGTDGSARSILRAPTIARALSGFKAFILVFLALLATLGEIGIPVGSVVTIGGLIAVAVSLAAQNFVRDFLNGFLVLFEDQYVMGDFVTINGMTGLVEQLTLRMVQVRDSEGSLVTVPHSSVTNVVNHSRNWSRVDYRLSLDPAADPFRAIELLRGALEEIAHDPAWRDAVLVPVEWIGIEGFTHDWTLLRASVKTAPLRQYELRREINARVRRAFAAEKIGYGPPITADQIPPA